MKPYYTDKLLIEISKPELQLILAGVQEMEKKARRMKKKSNAKDLIVNFDICERAFRDLAIQIQQIIYTMPF